VAFTYDLTTVIGKTRLRIPDRIATDYLFEDAELQVFLDDNGDDTRLAAADALETIASDSVLLLKAVTLLDVTTNGPAMATALMARAAGLREQVSAEDEDAGFDVAEMDLGPDSRAEQRLNEAAFGD
jgi:hypothetical protein